MDTETTATETTRTDAEVRDAAPALKLEVVVIPVSDVDRAKAFYAGLGWTLDVDLDIAPGYRVVEFTPPGSPTSIIFGTGVTEAAPGSVRGLQLVASDIEAAREELAAGGALVSEVFHDETGVFHHGGTIARVPGLAPDRSSYGSWIAFEDPDGNEWLVQEVTQRIPGRVVQTRYDSPAELAAALRAAAEAHGAHEARIGHEDAGWPEWYAEYMVRAAAGQELPE
ncbi:glyoxalase [Agromyces intestinalis]|uniref:Glyoxalase n=1 Tax=Agromyces intestinalis TaxID=2592652 RepID=A0A5C1YA66_9MICO|nr:glyoxalase [Agromyces intestinalis]